MRTGNVARIVPPVELGGRSAVFAKASQLQLLLLGPCGRESGRRAVAGSAQNVPRSLRLHTPGCRYGDDSLLDSAPNHSAAHSVTYTAGSANRRESRTLKSRRQHQAPLGSQSLLLPARRSESAALLGHTSLHSCAASDSSLLSTLLDESCIQERTLVDSFWGLDEETDVREHSFRADRSMSVLNGGDMNTAQTQTSVINGYTCGDCSLHSERREALTAYSSSQKPSSSSSAVGAVSASASRSASADSVSMATTAGSTIYSRDKTRRHTGLLASVWRRALLHGRRALAYLVSIVTVLAPWLKEGRGVLASLSQSCLNFSSRAASSLVSIVTTFAHSTLLKMRQKGSDVIDVCAQARQRYCGSVNVTHLTASDGQLHFNESLCHSLLWAVRGAGSAGWFVAQSLLSVLWSAAASPGNAAAGAFWWLGTGWYQLVTLVSMLNVFILTRVLPKLYKLMLFLLPFLLLLGLWFWWPAALLSYLPSPSSGST
ncbi:hypothetical protein COCON_G00023140 [Conger conger]|uniref:SUN domain-containing protein n=1 Tax=Conger conger TaxID=82655 RepID=A0A9Q1DXL5_CONCO|nr:hypothetical protein COCON_G00023140 [Conger conger]